MKIPATRVKETTAPGAALLSTAEAKAHLRIDHTTEDAYIEGLIDLARQYVEKVTGRSLITRSYTAKLDAFPPRVLTLPYPPLLTVTSIKYTDEAGTVTTFASSNYHVDTYSEPGRVVLDSDSTWPSVTLADVNGVEIIWTAGYGATAASVPKNYLHAMQLLVAHLYENREAVAVAQGISVTPLPLAFEHLIQVDRASWF